MVFAENTRCIHRVCFALLKSLNDHKTGVFLIGLLDLLRRQASGTWNLAKEIIRVCGAVERDAPPRLRPRSGFRRMCMDYTADLRVFFVQFEMRRCIGGWSVVPLDFVSVQIHDDHILRCKLIIVHAARLYDKISALSVDPADIPPGIGDKSASRQFHVCFVYFFFQLF